MGLDYRMEEGENPTIEKRRMRALSPQCFTNYQRVSRRRNRRRSRSSSEFPTNIASANIMTYPKSWDSKPLAVAYPTVVDGLTICHNCDIGWAANEINPCTGVCQRCINANRQASPEPPSRSTSTAANVVGAKCIKCTKLLRNTNMGICRNVCRECSMERRLRYQRCISCSQYRNDCWNGVCHGCSNGAYFCEILGHMFENSNKHFKACWCLPYERRVFRRSLNMPPVEPYFVREHGSSDEDE